MSSTPDSLVLRLFDTLVFGLVAAAAGDAAYPPAVPWSARVAVTTVGSARHAATAPTYRDVARIFADRCVVCHSGEDAPRGLRLDDYDRITRGGDDGPVIKPGNPDDSELVRRIRGERRPRMPLNGPPYLSAEQIKLIEAWIRDGATRGDAAIPRTGAAKPTTGANASGHRTDKGSTGAHASGGDASAPASGTHGPGSDTGKPVTGTPPSGAGAAKPTTAPRVSDASPVIAQPNTPQQPRTVTYRDVYPVLTRRCVKCHTDDGLKSAPPEGLRLGTYEQILRGGERAVVIPGRPDASPLLRFIRGAERPRMPQDGPPFLSDEETSLVASWIAQGARNAAGKPAPIPVGRRVRFHGVLTARWAVDGIALVVTPATRLRDAVTGRRVRIRGVVQADGTIRATRIRGK